MADEKPLDQITDASLFEGARAPEPSPEPPADAQAGKPPEAQPPSSPTGGDPEPKGKEEVIPSWRLREEAEARRIAEKRAQELEILLTDLGNAARREKGQEKAPDFFEAPEQAVATIVMEAMRPYAEQTHRTMMALAKMTAAQAHSEKTVVEAEQAFLKAMGDRTLDVMDYERVVQSPNRWDACVQWHKRQRTLQEVGEDPAAYFERALESKLADPAFQTKLLEKLRAGASGSPTVVKIPPSLSTVTSAARASGEDLGDMSDASLYAFARK